MLSAITSAHLASKPPARCAEGYGPLANSSCPVGIAFIGNPSPTNKDQCKNGGFRNFTNPTFKNQGDCVSFVESQKTEKGERRYSLCQTTSPGPPGLVDFRFLSTNGRDFMRRSHATRANPPDRPNDPLKR